MKLIITLLAIVITSAMSLLVPKEETKSGVGISKQKQRSDLRELAACYFQGNTRKNFDIRMR